MIISDLTYNRNYGLLQVEAMVTWENLQREPFHLFFQTETMALDCFWPDPNALLIACFLNAAHNGEKRILVEGTICPLLKHNLSGSFIMAKTWYSDDFATCPVIESTAGYESLNPFRERSISLLTGGIDSLSIIQSNRVLYPVNHRKRISATVSVTHSKKMCKSVDEFHDRVQGRKKIADALAEDIHTIPYQVNTNIWHLNPSGYFYDFKTHGAQLNAVCSLFSKGYSKSYIASSFDAAYLHKHWGSHPQLDAYNTSSHFEIEHAGTEMTRFDKTRLVADWPVGLQHIHVCQKDGLGIKNCGTCEKCIRTMVMLEALGKLRTCTSFPENNIGVERLSYLDTYKMLFDVEQVYLYKLAIPGLIQRGRLDLVEELDRIFDGFHEREDETESGILEKSFRKMVL